MANVKTIENDGSVEAFLNRLTRPGYRQECKTLIEMMHEATGSEPRMWGSSIIGFGQYEYRYANGKPGRICLVGFAPRKQSFVLYITEDHERDADLLSKLGKIKTGQGCVYVKKLDDLHLPTLRRLLRRAVAARRAASTPAE
jgi:hypothetical protein